MKHLFAIATACLMLSACSTVKLPDFSLKNLAAFKDARIDGDFPDVGDAPEAPVDVRSDADWDEAAKDMAQLKRDFADPVEPASSLSEAEMDAEFARLKAKAQAYKADDPVGGIDE